MSKSLRPIHQILFIAFLLPAILIAACQATPAPTLVPAPPPTNVPPVTALPQPTATLENTPTPSTIGLTFIAQYDPTSQILTIFSTTPGATIVYNGKPVPVQPATTTTAIATATATETHTPPPKAPVTVAAVPTTATTATVAFNPALLRGKIMFKTDRDGGSYPNNFSYYSMDLDGSNPERLDYRPADLLYATQRDIKVGREQREPGGTRVVLEARPCRDRETTGCGLYILDEKFHSAMIYSDQELSTGEFFRKDKSWARWPVWSPANTYIAFASDHETPRGDGCVRTYNIFKKSPNPSGTERRLTTFCKNGAATTGHLSFSPDGQRLAFFSDDSTRKQVYVLDVGGDDNDFTSSNVRIISNNRFNDWDPLWIK